MTRTGTKKGNPAMPNLSPSTSFLDDVRADMACYDEAEFQLDHFQSSSEDTLYGRYISTCRRLLSASEAVKVKGFAAREAEEAMASETPGSAKHDRLAWEHGRHQASAKRFEAHVRALTETAKALRDKLPDIRDPEVRYRLDAELYASRLRRKLFLDILTTGRPSLGFFSSIRELPVSHRTELIALAKPDSPEGKSKTMGEVLAWLAEDKTADYLPEERRMLLESPLGFLPTEAKKAVTG